MGTFYIAVVFCTTLAGQPPECVEAYQVRDRHTGEMAVFGNGTECNVTAQTVKDAHSDALSKGHQQGVVQARALCTYDAKGKKP